MPTYDYVCDKCGYKYEKFQNMTAEVDTECPECGGEVRRLIGTGAGVIFKGSGFYQTDYKNVKKPASECGGCPSNSSCPPTKTKD